MITYRQLAEYLNKAERLQQVRQPGHGQSSDRPTKKRRRPSIPPDDLSSDREDMFCETEKDVERHTSDADEGFPGSAGESFDIPERRRSKRIK